MRGKEVRISASILSADFANLGEGAKASELAGADMLHCDVMDGHFVPKITFGADTVYALGEYTGLPLDAHLMVSNPEKHIDAFCKAGADIITIHYEASQDIEDMLREIKKRGVCPGLSIRPGTPAQSVFPLLGYCGLALVMTVEPGLGGQSLIEDTLDKIRVIKARVDELGLDVDIQADGGINPVTAPRVIEAGANILVAGNALFAAGDMKKTIQELKG